MQKKWAVCLFFMLCCMHNIIGDGLSAGIDHVCAIVMRVCPQATPIVVVAKTAAKCVGLGLGKFVIDKIRNYRQRKKDARHEKGETKKQEKEACFEVRQDPKKENA